MADPPLRPGTTDLNELAITEVDIYLFQQFHNCLANDTMELYQRCRHRWFGLDLRNGVCSQCRYRDRNNISLTFFSAENKLALDLVPSDLQELTQIEEMFIVRVHIYMQVMSIRGAQYKYSGHMVNFFRNIGTMYSQLPRLPEELDVIILRPHNAPIHDRLRRQFRRNFHMRREVIRT